MNDKSIYYNFLPVIILNVFNIIFAFIVPALIMRIYGAEYHGLISTISSITAYLMLVEAGITTSSIQALYKPLSNNNRTDINSTLNAIQFYYKRIGLIFSLLVLIISIVFPLLGAKGLEFKTVCLLILVMGLASSLEFLFFNKYKVLLQADKKLHVINWINVIGITLQGLLRTILILDGQSLVLVQLVPAIVYIARILIINIYIKKYYKYLDISVKPKMEALSQKWSVLTHQVANLIVNNTDTLVLSIAIGYNAVSIYSVYIMIINTLNMFLLQAFSHPIAAKLGHLLVKNDPSLFKKYYKSYEWIYYVLITVIFSVVAVMMFPFVSLYTQGVEGVEYKDWILVYLFTVVGLLSNYRIPQLTLIFANGDFSATKNQALIEAILNIVLSLILVKFIGIYGVLIGTVISFLYRTTVMILYANKKILKENSKSTFIRIISSCFIIIVVILVSRFFNIPYKIEGWLSWILYGIVTTLVAAIISLLILLATDYKQTSYFIKRAITIKK